MNNKTKDNIITFKVDKSIVKEMQGIHNRSEFLRSAVLAALGNHCPLCKGTGILTPNQKKHWKTFVKEHSLEECNDCNEFYLVCFNNPEMKLHQEQHR